jgi:DNA-binding transcriptional ArsR family regulator
MDNRTITDAAALKALGHPLRMDLLESLLIQGPGNATELARRLGDSPSNCSWHLRKLAEHGFVSEVKGATGRSRPWQATSEGVSWGKADAEPEVTQAGHGLTDMLLTRELQRLRAAQAVEHLEPPEWREASTVVQSALWLTAEEAEEISQELKELLMRHFDRMSHPERRPEGARLVSTVAWLSPRPESPRGDDEEEAR